MGRTHVNPYGKEVRSRHTGMNTLTDKETGMDVPSVNIVHQQLEAKSIKEIFKLILWMCIWCNIR